MCIRDSAPGGLGQQQHLGVCQKPPAQDDFLLVAARKRTDLRILRRRFDAHGDVYKRQISMFAPSSVPSVTAPFSMNFMLLVPDASVPAVELSLIHI